MERLYHLVGPEQLTPTTVERINQEAAEYEDILKRGKKELDVLKGVIVCSFFCEESTRTRFSLESAAHRLGAKVISTENAAQFSAMAPGKEESLENSIKVISGVAAPHLRFADIIVIRHPEIGAAERAAKVSGVPIISGGDGLHHPFQVLKDLYTFKKILGRLDHFVITFCGDLRFSRIIGDLAIALSWYPGIEMIFTNPRGFELREEITAELREKGVNPDVANSLQLAAPRSDIAYVVRVQKNRLEDLVGRGTLNRGELEKLLGQYRENRGNYAVTKEVYDATEKRGTFFCHPMPVDKMEREIRPEVEDLSRVRMYEEANNGVPVGMAILSESWETQREIDIKQTRD